MSDKKLYDFFKGDVKNLGGFEGWTGAKKPAEKLTVETRKEYDGKLKSISVPRSFGRTTYEVGDWVYSEELQMEGEIVQILANAAYPIFVEIDEPGKAIRSFKPSEKLYKIKRGK